MFPQSDQQPIQGQEWRESNHAKKRVRYKPKGRNRCLILFVASSSHNLNSLVQHNYLFWQDCTETCNLVLLVNQMRTWKQIIKMYKDAIHISVHLMQWSIVCYSTLINLYVYELWFNGSLAFFNPIIFSITLKWNNPIFKTNTNTMQHLIFKL